MKRRLFCILLLCFTLSYSLISQNEISVSLSLKSFDVTNNEICYNIILANESASSINLAGQNWRFFYNSSELSLIPDSLFSHLPVSSYSDLIVVQFQEEVDGTGTGALPFESSLGFLNFFIDLVDTNNGGVDILQNGELIIGQICFTAPLNGEFYCPEIIFADIPITGNYAPISVEVAEFLSSNNQESLVINQYNDSGHPTYQDLCIEFVEDTYDLCNDGIDNNNNGAIDCLDADCSPNIISVNVISPSCPLQNDGIITITAEGENLAYSIDGGNTYNTSSSFENLISNEYYIYVINEVTDCLDSTSITILPVLCDEICGDGIDNDNNELIDCEEAICAPNIIDVDVMSPSCPLQNDAIITITAEGENLAFSIDGGNTYNTSFSFENLIPDEYSIYVINEVTSCLDSTSITILPVLCDEICGDGIDNDNNGLTDCEEAICGTPILVNIILNDPECCNNYEDGQITIISEGPNMAYSIDGGNTMTSDSIFTDLEEGEYTIVILNEVSQCSVSEDVVLTDIECIEICGDGIDNDCDSLVDEQDSDCGDALPLFTYSNVLHRTSSIISNRDYIIQVNYFKISSINEITVFDRWGNKVYQSKDRISSEGNVWTVKGIGTKFETGVYVVLVNYTTNDNIIDNLRHTITVL